VKEPARFSHPRKVTGGEDVDRVIDVLTGPHGGSAVFDGQHLAWLAEEHGGFTTTGQRARQRCLAPVYCLSCAEPLTARRRGRLRDSNGREGVRESPEGGVR